jgi:hypothetical protein
MATTGIQVQGSTGINAGGTNWDRSQLRALLPTLVFDIAGPLALYWLLRAAGTADVTALIASGILPAIGVVIGIVRHHRIDAIGSLVLLGIVAGTIAGLLTHSARLVLMEGSVPTAVFALACFGSLLTPRPLMYRIALQARGASTTAGRALQTRWELPAVQHALRFITLVWGATMLAEAATRVLIIETISAGSALMIIKLMPYIVIVGLLRWTGGYTRRLREQAAHLPAAEPQPTGADPAPALAQR